MPHSTKSENELRESLRDIWVDGLESPAVLPRTSSDVQDVISSAIKHDWKILIVGKGRAFSTNYVIGPKGLTLINLKINRVSRPDPSDMVIECESGVLVSDLISIVSNNGFRLNGWEESWGGTVGGYLCGERGCDLGSSLIGVDMVDGRGNQVRFGGRNRKDVAGFNVAQTILGSQGRLGWIERFFIKLSPGSSGTSGYTPSRIRTTKAAPERILSHLCSAFDPHALFQRNLT